MTINQKQVTRYMKNRKEALTQDKSAIQSGISVRTGRTLENGEHCSQQPGKGRTYKTRANPLDDVWDQEIRPLLESQPTLTAAGLFDHLEATYGDRYTAYRRSLQRKVRQWKLSEGKQLEVIFRQNHPPGQQAQVDFTEFSMKNDPLMICIGGNPMTFKLLHVRFCFSGWSYAQVILGGESFTALTTGVAAAFERRGGVPAELRTDSLSAAYKNLSKSDQEDLTELFDEFCKRYEMKPTRNNRGVAHENGVIESSHGHLKRRLAQHLKCLFPDNHDSTYHFETLAEFQAVIDAMMERYNKRFATNVGIERMFLQALPSLKAVTYTTQRVKVTTSSTVSIKRVLYSVPSRMIGATLNVHIYDNRLEFFSGIKRILTLDRVHPKGKQRMRVIDYRHVIHSLVKKPMAFYNAELRDDILPNKDWRRLWQDVMKRLSTKDACYLIVDALSLASQLSDEEKVAHALRQLLASTKEPTTEDLRRQLAIPLDDKLPDALAQVVDQHPLSAYDQFLGGRDYARHLH